MNELCCTYYVGGYFPLGETTCIVWATMDVLLCTASIWHMATISVDRYCALHFPLRYRRTKSPLFVGAKIACVWLVSVGICSSLAVSGLVNPSNVYHDGQCSPAVTEFVLYGSIVAFYVPLVVMVVTYALTVRTLSRTVRTIATTWRNQIHIAPPTAAHRDPFRVRTLTISSSTSDQHHPETYASMLPAGSRDDKCTATAQKAAGLLARAEENRVEGLQKKVGADPYRALYGVPSMPELMLIREIASVGSRQRVRDGPIRYASSHSALTTATTTFRPSNDDNNDDNSDDEVQRQLTDSRRNNMTTTEQPALGHSSDDVDRHHGDDNDDNKYNDEMQRQLTDRGCNSETELPALGQGHSNDDDDRHHGDDDDDDDKDNDQIQRQVTDTCRRGHVTAFDGLPEVENVEQQGVQKSNLMSASADLTRGVMMSRPNNDHIDPDASSRSHRIPSSNDVRSSNVSCGPGTSEVARQRHSLHKHDDDDDDDDDVNIRNRHDISLQCRQTSRLTSDDVRHTQPVLGRATLDKTAKQSGLKVGGRQAAVAARGQSMTGSRKRKATRVLGVMFVVFVALWTPFFVLNILSAVCPSCVQSVAPTVWTTLVWLGWISSLANPIIYTSFSPAFRSAFRRLLTCRRRQRCQTSPVAVRFDFDSTGVRLPIKGH